MNKIILLISLLSIVILSSCNTNNYSIRYERVIPESEKADCEGDCFGLVKAGICHSGVNKNDWEQKIAYITGNNQGITFGMYVIEKILNAN